MYKAGTVEEILVLKEKIPDAVYRNVLRIVTVLDESYGEDRDIDDDDGGFVFIAESKDDLDYFARHYMKLTDNLHEAITLVKAEKEPYLDVFYLCNNEYGINLFIPISILPAAFLHGQQGNIQA